MGMSLLTNGFAKAPAREKPKVPAQGGHPWSMRRILFIWIVLIALFWALTALGVYALFKLIEGP
jgi:hypothetical protein